MSVTFNGITRRINVDNNITSIDMLQVYSDWKEWLLLNDNSKYLPAFSVVGGDPLPGSRFLGTTIFLENNWKIKPYEGNHTLTVSGNLFTRDGSSPFVQTNGNFNVSINLSTSNLVDTVATSGSQISINDIVNGVFNKQIESQLSFENSIKLISAVLAGKVVVNGNTITFKNAIDDDKSRVIATTDNNGNRTNITYDLT